MIPEIFQEFEKILSKREVGNSILEIGAVPGEDSLLNLKALRKATEKIGINLDGGKSYKGRLRGKNYPKTDDKEYPIIEGNANNMSCFEDNQFDTVLCNSVLEHDKFFWKTIAEIRRVVKDGGLVVIGAPGYDRIGNIKLNSTKSRIRREFLNNFLMLLAKGTTTLPIHNYPGDYYRFTPQAFKEVIFEKMNNVEIYSYLIPPRIIGVGNNTKI